MDFDIFLIILFLIFKFRKDATTDGFILYIFTFYKIVSEKNMKKISENCTMFKSKKFFFFFILSKQDDKRKRAEIKRLKLIYCTYLFEKGITSIFLHIFNLGQIDFIFTFGTPYCTWHDTNTFMMKPGIL